MQILANGIISGLTISVLAMAFSVVYLPTRVFHIALGGIYAAVPFVAWTALRDGWPGFAAVLLAVSLAVGLSLACEQFNHARLERNQAPEGAHLIASLGIYIVLVQIVALIWGSEPKVLRQGVDQVFTAGGLILSRAQLVAGGGALVALALFFVWLRYSLLGLQFRALADNPRALALQGYNIRQLRLLAFGVSGLLGATAALLVAYDVGFDPHGGLPALLLAIVAVIIGGRQSFLGPMLGGLLLGVVRSQVVWFLSARWQAAVTFALLALFLYVRPHGLVGRKMRLEAGV
ncbi:MAG: branched-chain amino acid ABC transporter permease [Bacteroidota bacterium]